VEVSAAGKTQFRWIHANHSYKSGGALEAHFARRTKGRSLGHIAERKALRVAGLDADRFLDLNLPQKAISIVEPSK